MVRSRQNVSVYWLWLVVIGGILAVLPEVPYSGPMGGNGLLPVVFLYCEDFCNYSDPYSALGDDKWILLHAAMSAVLAVIATVIHHAWAKRRHPEHQPDPKTFSLGGLLLMIAALACVFSLLASLGAIYAIYLVVLIFVAGRGATLLLAAVGL